MPAEIGVYTGEPAIEFDFEDQLAIYPGHNFFRGRIKNSAGVYQLRAQIANADGERIAGVDHSLFRTDRLFATDSLQNELQTSGEFVLYVFVRPAIDQLGNRMHCSLSAQERANAGQQISREIELKYQSDPLIAVRSVRDVGKYNNGSRPVGMMPWRTNSIDHFSLPNFRSLKLNALANLKSKFEFQFTNNSSISMQDLTLKLFLLSRSRIR